MRTQIESNTQVGYWKVLEFVGVDHLRRTIYRCQCKCGAIKDLVGSRLASGKTSNCRDCKRLDVPIGEFFGKWKVLDFGDVVKNKTRWRVRCTCGKESLVFSANLIRSISKQCRSCGYKTEKSGIPQEVWKCLQREAIARNYAFELSREYAWDLFCAQGGKCALSGLPIIFTYRQKEKYNRTASLDRIDNKVGYVEGNVQWLHKKVNMMKYKYEVAEFIEICHCISKYQSQEKQ